MTPRRHTEFEVPLGETKEQRLILEIKDEVRNLILADIDGASAGVANALSVALQFWFDTSLEQTVTKILGMMNPVAVNEFGAVGDCDEFEDIQLSWPDHQVERFADFGPITVETTQSEFPDGDELVAECECRPNQGGKKGKAAPRSGHRKHKRYMITWKVVVTLSGVWTYSKIVLKDIIDVRTPCCCTDER